AGAPARGDRHDGGVLALERGHALERADGLVAQRRLGGGAGLLDELAHRPQRPHPVADADAAGGAPAGPLEDDAVGVGFPRPAGEVDHGHRVYSLAVKLAVTLPAGWQSATLPDGRRRAHAALPTGEIVVDVFPLVALPESFADLVQSFVRSEPPPGT